MQADALRAWFGAQMDCHLVEEQDDTLLILHAPALAAEEMIRTVRSLCERFAAAHADSAAVYFGIGTPQGVALEYGGID